MNENILLSWSSGKDSAWTLYELQKKHGIKGLFTTINKKFNRVAMHAVRVELLKKQAQCLNLPITIIELPYPCNNEEYGKIMESFLEECLNNNIQQIAFGDLYLEDIKDYRIKQMQSTDIEPIFPIWKKNTKLLANQMIEEGLKAIITCVDPKQLDPSFCGRKYDLDFLKDLPDSIDPCGENGEFHSFVYDGPMFQNPMKINIGETIERDGFYFTDLI
ncbi:MAG: ATP-binding protein [Planctomycetota bacterium]|nr:MAG: ATP-binding protein [Planctomycetota bacterium]